MSNYLRGTNLIVSNHLQQDLFAMIQTLLLRKSI
eukprot:gene9467-6649_t